MDGGRHGPVALAQDLLDLRIEIGLDLQVGIAPILFQHDLHAVEIAERLVHVGLIDLDIAEMDGRVALDHPIAGGLAHDLSIDHGILRHIDHKIALDRGGTGEAAAFRQRAHFAVALFLRTDRGNVIVGRGDAMLGEMAFLDLDLTTTAGSAATADTLDIDAELARGIKYRRADGETTAFTGRHEEDEGINFSHEQCIS